VVTDRILCLAEVADRFQIFGSLLEAVPHGSGHINDTYACTFSVAGTRVRYILQRINRRVFPDAGALMGNIGRVTAGLHRRLAESGVADASRCALTVVPSREGRPWVEDAAGDCWRCYLFIEGARTYDTVDNPRHAFEAAAAFGRFQVMLADLEGPRLHETIPHFHHTRERLRRLEQARDRDAAGRSADVTAEWDAIRRRESLVDILVDLHADGSLPERITHNDTKVNNVMIDDATGRGICVIDLDTVMPGLSLYDFGDMVRTATSPAAEDERDLSRVGVRLPMFEALVRGYLSAAGEMLTPVEKAHLVPAGKLITLESAIRFLTDHLDGDVYFKTSRDGHNLDRCRTQLALVADMERQEEDLHRIVREAAR